MANQNALAGLLILMGIVLLATVNELGWLLLLFPAAYLLARNLGGKGPLRNIMARESKKG